MTPNRSVSLLERATRSSARLSVGAIVVIAFSLTVMQAQAVFLKIGPLSVSVYLTVLSAFLVAFAVVVTLLHHRLRLGSFSSVFSEPRLRFVLQGLTPLLALLGLSAVRLGIEWRVEGAQNLLALLILVGGIALVAGLPSESMSDLVARWFVYLSGVLAVVFVVVTAAGLPGFANRQFAMIMLVGLSVAASIPPRNLALRWAPYAIAFSILFSGSRTASVVAIAIVSFCLWQRIHHKWSRIVSLVASASAALLVFALAYALLPWIFDIAGDPSPVEQRELFDSSGRLTVWPIFIGLLEKPADWVWGFGTGKAMEFGSSNFLWWAHPHNEYIRFLVDLGLVGLGLLLAGAVVLLVFLSRNHAARDPHALAAIILVFSLGAMATTDGPLYSSFVVVPAAVFIGLGLGAAASRRESIRR
jgi:hypothetical protein